jgi:hypothetical protein
MSEHHPHSALAWLLLLFSLFLGCNLEETISDVRHIFCRAKHQKQKQVSNTGRIQKYSKKKKQKAIRNSTTSKMRGAYTKEHIGLCPTFTFEQLLRCDQTGRKLFPTKLI